MLWRVKLISICRPLLGCLFHLAPSPDMTKCFSLFYFFVNSQDDQHLYTVWNLLPPSLAHHPRQSCAWVIHCGTHTCTHAHTWATYPASVLRWSCQIPHDKIPILWRSWLSRPPCAESPTQSRQQDKSSGVRWDSSHAVCFIILCDDSFWAPLLVAELIQN